MNEILKRIDDDIKTLKTRINTIDTINNPITTRAINNQIYAFSRAKQIIWSQQKEPCSGCKYDGKYENEIECGYPSPCTSCKRRCNDNYLNQPYKE